MAVHFLRSCRLDGALHGWSREIHFMLRYAARLRYRALFGDCACRRWFSRQSVMLSLIIGATIFLVGALFAAQPFG